MSKTILLALENESISSALAALLQAEGFAVIVETNGQWALRVFEKRSVQLVVLGALGGEKGGLELAAKIRRTIKGKTTPLLMVSDTPRKASILAAARRAYSLEAVIEAPLRSERLLELLHQVLGEDYPSAQQAAADRKRLDRLQAGRFAGPDSERERTEVEEHSGRFLAAPRSGSLTETPFPELLGQLYRERARGAMLLTRGRTKKIITFADGAPTAIRSNRLQECLGRFLVRAKLITEEECARSLQKMKASGRQQGAVLVAMGCISPTSMRRALELQLQMKLFDPFGWPDGTYRIDPAVRTPVVSVPLTISAATAIHRGIARKLDQPTLESRLAGDLALAAEPNRDPILRFQSLKLDETDQALLQKLPQVHSLRSLLEEQPTERLRLLRLLYCLKCTGMFTYQASTRATPPMPGPPEAAAALDLVEQPGANSRELTQVRKALAEELTQARRQDFFELLELSRQATREQVENGFRLLARRFHPDHATRTGSTQVRHLNAELFELICKAHRVLSDDALRRDYLEQLEAAGPLPPPPALAPGPAAPGPVDQALRAETMFSRGALAMRKKDYSYARAMLEQAVRLCPDEGEYRAELGLAMFRSDPDSTQVGRLSRDELNQAIVLSPMLDKPHLYLGWIYRHMGQRELSVHEFELALLCNPKCVDAIRELRLLRNRKPPRKKGLGRLLSKWKR